LVAEVAVAQDGSVDRDSPVMMTLDIERASVFDVYDELLVPLCFQPYADDVVTRLDDVRDGAVLEVACGTGAVTRALADALPESVAITATDIVPGMLDRAQQVGTARAVTWEVADALALSYADESFEVVVCQFGAMFFPSKVDAFAEAARVLRPGGRLELAVWDAIERNDFGAAVAEAMTELFPEDPPRFLERMPVSYADPEAIVADLVAGGFAAPAELEAVEHRCRAATPEVVASAFCGGTPVRDQLQAGDGDRLRRAITGAARFLADRFGRADLEGRNAALVVSAVKA
jgi:SAM-dependent methyltransferase